MLNVIKKLGSNLKTSKIDLHLGNKSLDLDAADVLRDYMQQNVHQVELKGASKHIEELLSIS